MDVDASERRPDGGRRRSHGAPVMQHPAANTALPRDSNVFQINAIRSYFHGLATPRPIGAPWPRQVVWRDVPKIGL
jgi:hypothetical protein